MVLIVCDVGTGCDRARRLTVTPPSIEGKEVGRRVRETVPTRRNVAPSVGSAAIASLSLKSPRHVDIRGRGFVNGVRRRPSDSLDRDDAIRLQRAAARRQRDYDGQSVRGECHPGSVARRSSRCSLRTPAQRETARCGAPRSGHIEREYGPCPRAAPVTSVLLETPTRFWDRRLIASEGSPRVSGKACHSTRAVSANGACRDFATRPCPRNGRTRQRAMP